MWKARDVWRERRGRLLASAHQLPEHHGEPLGTGFDGLSGIDFDRSEGEGEINRGRKLCERPFTSEKCRRRIPA